VVCTGAAIDAVAGRWSLLPNTSHSSSSSSMSSLADEKTKTGGLSLVNINHILSENPAPISKVIF